MECIAFGPLSQRGVKRSSLSTYRGRVFFVNERERLLFNSNTPLEDHPLDTHREPSAPYCWILEILYCTPKGRRALLRIPTTGRAKCLPMLGAFKT